MATQLNYGELLDRLQIDIHIFDDAQGVIVENGLEPVEFQIGFGYTDTELESDTGSLDASKFGLFANFSIRRSGPGRYRHYSLAESALQFGKGLGLVRQLDADTEFFLDPRRRNQ